MAFRAIGGSNFDRLYQRHAASVYRYVYAVLGNHADAEDVTQQTFLNAYRAMAQGTKPRKAENWLLTIAHNEVRRHFRRTHGRPIEVELDADLADSPSEGVEPSLGDVLRALQHLPPSQRAALVMREFEGRTYAEIAEIMNVTQDALEGLIFRARRGLAEHLEGAFTCAEAEDALLRRMDARLPRPDARRLKEHLRECQACVRFSTVQRRQRSLLKGLSILPIPASLYVFRGEQAALAAAGVGTATAASSTAVVGGGMAATGALGLAAKAAAVAASAAVVGGVGYGVSTGAATIATKTERKAAHAAAVEQTRRGQRAADVRTAHLRGERPGPAPVANASALKKPKGKPRANPAAVRKGVRPVKVPGRRALGRTKARVSPPQRASGKPSAAPRERAKTPVRRGRPAVKRPRPETSRADEAATKKAEPPTQAPPVTPPVTPPENRGRGQEK